MTNFIRRVIQSSPFIRKSDGLWVLLPTLLWVASYFVRPHIVELHCQTTPEQCSPERSFWSIDAYGYRYRHPEAKVWSDRTQYAAGAVAVILPLAVRALAPGLSTALLLKDWGAHVLLLAEATLWNGAVNDSIRLYAQRPRPYVLANPTDAPGNVFQYTSFYSGHTSFAALAGASALFTALLWKLPALWAWIIGLTGALLTLSTAVLRVLAGFHWVTDTLAGAVAGLVIAFWIRWVHASPAKTPEGSPRTST